MKKFCCVMASVTPRMRAKVMVVVARVIQVRFFMNSSVRRRLGTTKRMTKKLSSEAMMA